MENLVGQIVEVIVSKNGKVASKNLKVCKVNSRSILFIEVDKINRKNTFRKFKVKNVEKVGTKTDGGTFVLMEDAIMPDKWESSWDSIGQPTQQIRGRGLASQFSKHFSNHSKGWAPTIKAPMGSSIDALAANPHWKNSTTNSAVGFPMV
jgi:hypothetical protein